MEAAPRALFLAAACAFALCAAPAPAADTSSVATLPKPVAAGTAWTEPEIATLGRDIDAILARASTLRGAHVGLLAIETGTGRSLYARAPGDAFLPASNFKLLTGSAALAKLGPGFTFKTVVALDGASRLVLVGGGDALLRATDLDDAAAAVAAAGLGPIAQIDADVSLFDGQRYGLGWSWEDFPYYYAPVTSAVCLEDNVVHATVTPGVQGGVAAVLALAPAVGAALGIENRVLTGAAGSTDTVDVERDGSRIVFTGSIPQDAKSEQVDAAVPDPGRYALSVFVQALVRRGANLAGGFTVGVRSVPPVAPYRPIWTHESAPLASYLADFWYPSDNLVGEMLIKSMGVARSGAPGTTANGAALEAEWLRSLGVDPQRVDIADGSGLSVYDRISPRTLVRILQTDWNGPNRAAVVDAMPVAGVRGSLREDFRKTLAEGRVFAKTGTLRHTRAISGYLRPLRHGAITFSLMVDDWLGEDTEMDDLRARLLSRFIQ